MRGYAAIVGVFRQNADFCLIGPPSGSTSISSPLQALADNGSFGIAGPCRPIASTPTTRVAGATPKNAEP